MFVADTGSDQERLINYVGELMAKNSEVSNQFLSLIDDLANGALCIALPARHDAPSASTK